MHRCRMHVMQQKMMTEMRPLNRDIVIVVGGNSTKFLGGRPTQFLLSLERFVPSLPFWVDGMCREFREASGNRLSVTQHACTSSYVRGGPNFRSSTWRIFFNPPFPTLVIVGETQPQPSNHNQPATTTHNTALPSSSVPHTYHQVQVNTAERSKV